MYLYINYRLFELIFIILILFILERQSVKVQLYNFSDLSSDRAWLYKELLSDTDSDTEISDEDEYIREMLKTHVKEQRMRENFYKKATVKFTYICKLKS